MKDWADKGREKQIRLLREMNEKMITKMLMIFSQSDEISVFQPLILYFLYYLLLNKKYLLYLEKILFKSYSDYEKATTELLVML